MEKPLDVSKVEILLATQIEAFKGFKEDIGEIKESMKAFQARCDTDMRDTYDRLRAIEGWQQHCNGEKAAKTGAQFAVYVYATLAAACAGFLAWVKS